MGFVFISYRRDQAAAQARALYVELQRQVGTGRVFMDVDDIAPGIDYRAAIADRLQRCDAVVVLVGPGWAAQEDAQGRRRLDDPDDLVRREVAMALSRGIPVTPVLIDGAVMPAAQALPDEISALAWRQGVSLRHDHWGADVAELVRRFGGPPRSRSRRRWGMAIALSVVVAAAAAGAWWWSRPDPPALASTSPPRSATASGKTVGTLVAELSDPDPAIRRQAAVRLRTVHAGSPEVVTRALARLHTLNFDRLSREARIELLGVLSASEDSAWTPSARVEAADLVRRHRAAIEAGTWKPGPESRLAFQRFDERFGR